jgi:hypothetical protein
VRHCGCEAMGQAVEQSGRRAARLWKGKVVEEWPVVQAGSGPVRQLSLKTVEQGGNGAMRHCGSEAAGQSGSMSVGQ